MQISNAEWQVMRIIWSQEQTTSKEITQLLQEKFHWTASTVKTLLTRLVAKNIVTTKKTGNRYLYSPLITEEASVLAISQDVSNKVCTKKIPLVIMDLIQQNELTAEDVADLMTALQAKEVVGEITCDCLPENHQC
ncbi:CopY/TcrY family copper transport repressor [Enterococcus sp. DIV2402]|uniref:CopY/TcrY family copper transport repressor n=1 Tax=Candidatus Enterococcus lowellii TaxID=2230877 RepID=A0ABZ2SJA9_9ENTE|nr:CopY/TcrY family copper transport repressor [Enterococcus sp. DIV2402]MBO0465278.1 CopY/TcrY family copper transport repressor [Enterococcus sp. DIV2402]